MRVWILVGLALVLVGLALFWTLQRRLIYYPFAEADPRAASPWPTARDVSFETEDGLQLAGLYVPAAGGDPSAWVLVFNGNAGSRHGRWPLARALAGQGLSVLLFDYRGYGGNPGSPSEPGLIRDARAAVSYLASRDDVDPERIVYFGESLGAAVAVALAAERPPAVLILRSPFTSLVDMGKLHYPLLPVALMLRDRFPSDRRIARVDCPLLVVAGDRDSLVPHEQSRRLYDLAPSPVKQFVSIPGAEHNDERLALTHSVEAAAAFLAGRTEGAGLSVAFGREDP